MSPSLAGLLLADGRLPVGSYAYSSGLEPAVKAGLAAADVPDYLRSRLTSVGRVEAAATVLSHRRAIALARMTGAGDSLVSIQAELLARNSSEPLRRASRQLGRGLARLVGRLWPDAPSAAELGKLDGGPVRPVALGVAAALGSTSEQEAARIALYDDMQTVTAAALKLLPVDPLVTVEWILSVENVIGRTATEALDVTSAAGLPADTAPMIEQWSLEHHLDSRRLFSA